MFETWQTLMLRSADPCNLSSFCRGWGG